MNQTRNTNAQFSFNFRHWSRKGYAVFASLGKLVRIATLKTEVSALLTCKSVAQSSLSLLEPNQGEDDDCGICQEDLLDWEAIPLQFIQLTTVQRTTNGIAAQASPYNIFYPIDFGRWGFLLPNIQTHPFRLWHPSTMHHHLLRIKNRQFTNPRNAFLHKTFPL